MESFDYRNNFQRILNAEKTGFYLQSSHFSRTLHMLYDIIKCQLLNTSIYAYHHG